MATQDTVCEERDARLVSAEFVTRLVSNETGQESV
jgi:hypothetical protein